MQVEQIHNTARIINNATLIAFLTETVFGLGANALNPIAVANIFAFKEWPSFDLVMVVNLAYDDIRNSFFGQWISFLIGRKLKSSIKSAP